jgi:hypothetical protein
MDITKFNFPEPSLCLPTNKELLKEAESRGFMNGHTPYNSLFSDLFFNGGKVKFKDEIDQDFKEKAWPYLKSFMGSFEPKHEHKEAICALLLSELVVAQ